MTVYLLFVHVLSASDYDVYRYEHWPHYFLEEKTERDCDCMQQ